MIMTILYIILIILLVFFIFYKSLKYEDNIIKKVNENIEFRGYKPFDWSPYYLEFRHGEDCYSSLGSYSWHRVWEFVNDDSEKRYQYALGTYKGPGMKEVEVSTKEDVDKWRNKFKTFSEFEKYLREQKILHRNYLKEQENKRTL